MDRETLTHLIDAYIRQSYEGQEIENNKIDFKLKWYDLTSKKGENEFLKDTSAIANTFGLDGFIIIGYDPKTKQFNPSQFSDCGKKDPAELMGLISKRVDRIFDFSSFDITVMNQRISVIHIPPSIDKPHLITNYQTFDKNENIKNEEQQKIFVRKNTSTYPASKHDLELMYYDRKNIIPEYRIISTITSNSLEFSTTNLANQCTSVKLTAPIFFENVGSRPVSISRMHFIVSLFSDATLISESINLFSSHEIVLHPIILKPGDIVFKSLQFTSEDYNGYSIKEVHSWIQHFRLNSRTLIFSDMLFIFSNGSTLSQNLTVGNL
ncbi:ATP-binding protein [Lacibacter luteus]|uniref:ATP-binding protein n=1 Tax=Lacibacter luteus TaxID=2508719 RepID=A0A4Q1CGY3_9BACT|nr:ATP-binding protein [Lacibacter luteus]RXK59217.1 ATP-binding protein [Lacibacter luteus]